MCPCGFFICTNISQQPNALSMAANRSAGFLPTYRTCSNSPSRALSALARLQTHPCRPKLTLATSVDSIRAITLKPKPQICSNFLLSLHRGQNDPPGAFPAMKEKAPELNGTFILRSVGVTARISVEFDYIFVVNVRFGQHVS